MPFVPNDPRAGRRKGSKNRRTIEVAVAEEQLRQSIMKNLTPIAVAAINATMGERFIYRIHTGAKGAQGQPQLVSDPHKIAQALEAIQNDNGCIDRDYYYVQTKPSNTHALGILLDRAFGKAKENKADPSANDIMLGELLRRALEKGRNQNDTMCLPPVPNASQVNFGGHNLP